jgi:MurNAc alpha-1-phosphate uridylyltransferase
MGLAGGRVTRDGPRFTYANIAVYHPSLFAGIAPGTPLRLFPWAYAFVEAGRVTGEHYRGAWDNLGTPDQLAALDRALSRKASQ